MLFPKDQLPFYSLFMIYSTTLLTGTLFLLWRRNKEPLQSRGIGLLLLQSTAGFLSYLITAIGPLHVGCFLFNLRSLLFALWTFPYVFRGLLLWFRYVLQHALLSLQAARRPPASSRTGMTSLDQEDPPPSQEELELREASPSLPPLYSTADFKGHGEEEARSLRGWEIRLAVLLQRNKWVFTWKYDLLVFLVLSLVYISLVVGRYYTIPFVYSEEDRRNPELHLLNRCDLQDNTLNVGSNAILVLSCVMVVAVLLWSARDAYHVKHELLGVLIATIVLIMPWIAAMLGKQVGNFDRYFWAVCAALSYAIISIWMPALMTFSFERKISRYAARADGSSSAIVGPEIIYRIMGHAALRKNFSEFPSLYLFSTCLV